VRWQQQLSEFNLQVAYLPGKANVFSDGLSCIRRNLVAALAQYDGWLAKLTTVVESSPEARVKQKSIYGHPKNDSDACVLLNGLLY
jgi:hypothetical protein